ncbi:hypothetical protein AB1Y20_009261 [Prymnesium parvum]|uniref:legumain n=1 Tax=Prymnesium parvum TaxID=97485 RepID=A0AB34K1L1_PRYPA
MLSIALASAAYAAKDNDVADHWAVLVAGSSGFGNYRHQADVCHAYQIFKRAGVPESQIITLAVDDIAHSSENPFPGKIFNQPTAAGVPGVDVYAGCVIDYSGTQVTPETFTKVLTGDATGLNGGKVLKSTSSSRVFVNFVDHGGVDIIGFPETTMHAKELVGALQTMNTKQMYKELVFYLEACESGSMFLNLPANIRIYATTAANAAESSWGTYCMPDDMVDGKHVGSCLGDLYSVNWMQDTDKALPSETLGKQYERVKQLTTKSHVLQFGDETITSEPVTAFEGDGPAAVEAAPQCYAMCSSLPTMFKCLSFSPCAQCSECQTVEEDSASAAASLPSADAALSSAFHRFITTGSDKAATELMRGVQARQLAKTRFDAISRKVANRAAVELDAYDNIEHDCHFAAYKAYKETCGEWDVEALVHSTTLAKLCKHTRGDSREITAAMKSVCA